MSDTCWIFKFLASLPKITFEKRQSINYILIFHLIKKREWKRVMEIAWHLIIYFSSINLRKTESNEKKSSAVFRAHLIQSHRSVCTISTIGKLSFKVIQWNVHLIHLLKTKSSIDPFTPIHDQFIDFKITKDHPHKPQNKCIANGYNNGNKWLVDGKYYCHNN